MVTVVLDIGDNGVVKIIEDDNYNGNGEVNVTKTLYVFDGDPDYENRIKFLKDLCLLNFQKQLFCITITYMLLQELLQNWQ